MKSVRKNINKFCEANERFKEYLDFIREGRPKQEYYLLDSMKKHLDNISLLFRKLNS